MDPQQARNLLNANLAYRGRPYTKAVPFAKQFVGGIVGGEAVQLWVPVNAYFELALLLLKGSVAADYSVCDSTSGAVIGYIQVDGINYSRLDLGLAAVRSDRFSGAQLLLFDPTDPSVAADVKGVAYGWEVTKEGSYR